MLIYGTASQDFYESHWFYQQVFDIWQVVFACITFGPLPLLGWLSFILPNKIREIVNKEIFIIYFLYIQEQSKIGSKSFSCFISQYTLYIQYIVNKNLA